MQLGTSYLLTMGTNEYQCLVIYYDKPAFAQKFRSPAVSP